MHTEPAAKTVIVIDEDVATFKGISRLGKQEGYTVIAFDRIDALIEWLGDKDGRRLPEKHALCLVIDVKSLVADQRWSKSRNIQPLSKICIGTAAANTSMGYLMNNFEATFIRKPFTLAKISNAIAYEFERYTSLADEASQNQLVLTGFSRLTSREREVAELVGKGAANLEIADLLGITLKTVKAHRAKVMEKTQSGTIADFVRKFERYRVVARKNEGRAPEKAAPEKAAPEKAAPKKVMV